MIAPGKHVIGIAVRSVLIASLLFSSPIGIVWFGAVEAEKRVARGDLPGAERWLQVIEALSTYPLLPKLVEARVHGVRCEFSSARGDYSEAMDSFLREMSLWAGRDLAHAGTKAPEEKTAGLSSLRFRKGAEAWQRGYGEWIVSSPASMPDFDREFLPPAPANGEDLNPSSSDRTEAVDDEVYLETLRDLFNRASRGERMDEIQTFLDGHPAELEAARRLASESAGVAIPETAKAADAFRLLVLDLIRSCQTHNESGTLEAFDLCGRILRRIEAEPSLVALLATHALRTEWCGALEILRDHALLSPPVREGLARDLNRYRSTPDFPELCMRHEYAGLRETYVDSLLDGNWETASPSGRRLFVHCLERLFARQSALAAALAEDADPGESSKTFSRLHEVDGVVKRLLVFRKTIAGSFYGSDPLTEQDGRDFAGAVDEAQVVLLDGIVTPKLGRLDESLRELRARENELIEILRKNAS